MKKHLITASLLTLLGASSALAQMAPGQPPMMPGQPVPPSDHNGVYCREYTQPVVVGGKKVSSYGTACQQPDGTWRIVSNNMQSQAQSDQLEVLGPPEYTSAPRYMVPPPEYYYPPPAYEAYPYPYPYGAGVVIGFSDWHGGGWHDGGWHGGYHGGGFRH